jgi:peptidoglycan/xylan/chitin deacetylase (PgdA/CDA1 family)
MLASEEAKIRERLINLAGSFYLLRKRKNYAYKPGVTIVNYHRISGSSFRRHLDYIRLHYQVLSPQNFLDWLDDKIIIAEPSVVITFDDGYVSFYQEIYPILMETKTPVFMFIPTGFVGESRFFWEDELEVALQKTNAGSIAINGRKFYLCLKLYRTDFQGSVLRYLRFLDAHTRNEIRKDLLAQLNVNITESDMKGYRFLTWPHICEMEKTGLLVFGSHTVNHPNLITISDEAVKLELTESKRTLEDHIGKSVRAFAYPYGGAACFDGRIINQVEEAGYACAFTTIQGRIKEKSKNRFTLERVMLFDYQNEGAVALKLDRCKK